MIEFGPKNEPVLRPEKVFRFTTYGHKGLVSIAFQQWDDCAGEWCHEWGFSGMSAEDARNIAMELLGAVGGFACAECGSQALEYVLLKTHRL